MTQTKLSSNQMRKQADKIAETMKAVSRGEVKVKDSAYSKYSVKFGIITVNGVQTIEVSWEDLKTHTEAELSAFVYRIMRGDKATLN